MADMASMLLECDWDKNEQAVNTVMTPGAVTWETQPAVFLGQTTNGLEKAFCRK